MAEWVNVAEGTTFSNLKQLVGDRELPKGTPVEVRMNVGSTVARLFDLWGAEYAFSAPPGMDRGDVHSDGSYGVVELTSDPAWISDMVNYIIGFWWDVALSGIKLVWSLVKIVIRAFIDIAEEAIWKLIVWPSVVIGGVFILAMMARKGGQHANER